MYPQSRTSKAFTTSPARDLQAVSPAASYVLPFSRPHTAHSAILVARPQAKSVVAPLDRVKILFQSSNPDFRKYAGESWRSTARVRRG